MPFSYFDTLAKIYRKDKATREVSETFVEVVQNIKVDMANKLMIVNSDDKNSSGETNSST